MKGIDDKKSTKVSQRSGIDSSRRRIIEAANIYSNRGAFENTEITLSEASRIIRRTFDKPVKLNVDEVVVENEEVKEGEPGETHEV